MKAENMRITIDGVEVTLSEDSPADFKSLMEHLEGRHIPPGRFVTVLPVDLPREANRLWSSAHLETGISPVVVKLTQDRHYWGFRLDVVDWHWQGRRGDVITGAEAAEWPAP